MRRGLRVGEELGTLRSCIGVISNRKSAQGVIDNVTFRWLAANTPPPDFRTITTFRRKHLENIKLMFLQVLLMSKQAGMFMVGVVALNGSKGAARAAPDLGKLSEQEIILGRHREEARA